MRKLQTTAYVALAALLGLGAAAPAFGQCTGDCNGDTKVTITEVVTMINDALAGTKTCQPTGGTVEVSSVVAAIKTAAGTNGMCISDGICGDGVVNTAQGEECDLGGTCAGGSKSGTACHHDADCGAGEKGVCDGGTGALKQCSADADCGGGRCARCRTFGGQPIPGDSTHTCAANCTFETRVPFNLKPGTFAGSTLQSGSGATVHSGILGDVPLPLTGSQTFTVGKPNATTGVAPVALKATDVSFPAIPVGGTLACACVRGIPAKTCGGFVLDSNGGLALDCSDNFGSTCSPKPCTDVCPSNLPCTFVHGPGNSGEGLLGCNGLTPINEEVTQESKGSLDPPDCLTPGIGAPLCADPFIITLSGNSPDSGSTILVTHTAIGVKTGACGDFCSDADPQTTRGTVNPLILTTGTASGLVTNVDGQDGVNNGPYSVNGHAVSCANLTAGNATGAKLSGTFTAINQNMLGDIVVEVLFEAQ